MWGSGGCVGGGGGGRGVVTASPISCRLARWLSLFHQREPSQDQVSSNGGRSGCVSGTCDIPETSGGGQQHHVTEQQASHDRTASAHRGPTRTQGPSV